MISGKHPVNMGLEFAKKLKIVGSNSTVVSTWKKILYLMEQGKLDLRPIVNKVLPLDRWQEGFDATINKTAYKVLLVP